MQTSRSNLPRFALPKANYRRRFELGLIFALSFTVMAFFFMRDWRMPVTVREHEPVILIVENTTSSERCAQAALRAALASRFTPARNTQGPVKYWLIQPYRFDLKN
ncbi:MAG: hypothetical protein ACREOI_23695 [bacterium]